MASGLYEKERPENVFFNEKILQIDSTKNGYQIKMKIPHLNSTTLKLDKYGDELIINLDNKRRNFFLPKFAHFHTIASYTYTAPWLNIQLVKS